MSSYFMFLIQFGSDEKLLQVFNSVWFRWAVVCLTCVLWTREPEIIMLFAIHIHILAQNVSFLRLSVQHISRSRNSELYSKRMRIIILLDHHNSINSLKLWWNKAIYIVMFTSMSEVNDIVMPTSMHWGKRLETSRRLPQCIVASVLRDADVTSENQLCWVI